MIISNIYKRAFNVLSKMPFKLWGLSLLSSLLTILVLVFGVLPIVIVPVIAVLSAGMAAVYLSISLTLPQVNVTSPCFGNCILAS